MKTLLTGTAAALLFAGAAHAAGTAAAIDVDGDGIVTQDEFAAYWDQHEQVFGEWDTDNDDMLSRAEFEAGVEMQDDADTFGTWDDRYGAWDLDEDEMLTADEYRTGLWETFDADEDAMWSMDETTAWEEDELRYDATRVGREVSSPGPADAGAQDGEQGGAATQ